MGIVTYCLLTGKLPFDHFDREIIIEKTLTVEVDYSDQVWNSFSGAAKDFVQKLLNRNPTERLSPTQALNHD